MIFAVTRSSLGYINSEEEHSPCEEAVYMECLLCERRYTQWNSLSTQEKNDWLSFGVNHKSMETFIERAIPHKAWFVRINDLWTFCSKHGSIIVSPSNSKDLTKEFYTQIGDDKEDCDGEIEIYDSLRE